MAKAADGWEASRFKKGIALKIAHANRPLREILERTGLESELCPENFFASGHEKVPAFQKG